MRALDLFSGIGGFALAAHAVGIETAAFCEIEPYPARVLNRHFPGVPVFPDVKELTACDLPDGIDLICGGFPCQDISYAGKGAGLEGSRSGLFYEVVRLIRELGPRYVLLENVAGLLTRGVGDVLGALAEVGYDAEWCCVRASDVGAPHRRDRIWILAYPQGTFDAPVHVEYVLSRLTPFGDERWHSPRAEGFDAGGGDRHSSLPQQAKAQTWPTATASDAWANDLDRGGMSGKHNLGLGTAVRTDAVWPTPTGGSDKKASCPGLDGGSYSRKMLDDVIGAAARKEITGSLNPDWVDALMGYPVGYTLPEGEPMTTLPDRWPAGLGAPQHAWEPPRLTTVKEHRAARLKCDGNSIVPRVALLWMESVVVHDGEQVRA